MRYVIFGLALLVLASCTGLPAAEPPAPLVESQAPAAVPTQARSIVGFVFVDANANGVLDAGETYIGNAVVTAQLGASVLTQATQAGWYGFVGLADGTWQVSATAEGYSCELRSAVVAGGKTTAHVPCRLGVSTATPTTTPEPAPASVGLAAQACPDADPSCVQVWLGSGSVARWWPACPEGRAQVSRFCLSTMGQWVNLP